MKYLNWTEDIRSCFVGDKKYCYVYPNPEFNANGKTYSGVAIAWLDGDKDNSFTVPFYTKYEDVSPSWQKIEERIKAHVEGRVL